MTGFLRFSGKLTETLEFTPTMGWETPVVLTPKDQLADTKAVVELHRKGELLTSVPIEVDFERDCGLRQHGVRTARIVAHVPFVKDGDELVLRVDGRVIYRRPVAAAAPTIEITDTKRDGDKMTVEWDAKSADGQRLRYRVVYIADGEHVTMLSQDTNRSSRVIDLSDLPGAKEGQIAILATDGIRSASVLSKPFRVDESEPEVWIQSPSTDEIAADQPLSLCGRAFDTAGRALPEEQLLWRVDGTVVAEGTCLASVDQLEPGKHRIELVFVRDGVEDVTESRTIEVAARSEGQERLADILARLDD